MLDISDILELNKEILEQKTSTEKKDKVLFKDNHKVNTENSSQEPSSTDNNIKKENNKYTFEQYWVNQLKNNPIDSQRTKEQKEKLEKLEELEELDKYQKNEKEVNKTKPKNILSSFNVKEFLEDENERIKEASKSTASNLKKPNYFDMFELTTPEEMDELRKKYKTKDTNNITVNKTYKEDNSSQYISNVQLTPPTPSIPTPIKNTPLKNKTIDIEEPTINIYEIQEKVYKWLFKELETFASVYIEYIEIFEDIEEFKTFKTSKYAKPINIKRFLYEYRKAERLEEKLNLLAINLGNYNIHLIFDKFKTPSDFINLTENEFLTDVLINYRGTSYDASYLTEFSKVVDGDESGKFVFKELSEEKPKIPTEIKKQEKKKGFFKK